MTGPAKTGLADPVEKYIDESIGHLAIRESQVVVAKDIADLGLIEHHSDERARGYGRVDGTERAICNSLFDVTPDVIFHFAGGRVKEHLREVVTFKRAEQQQPHESSVFAVEFQHIVGERSEVRLVVLAARSFVQVFLHPL